MNTSRFPMAVAAACLCALAGCGSFGHASYTLESKPGPDGRPAYDLKVHDGKEFDSRTVTFDSIPGVATRLVIEEGASKAFAGQAIGAKAMTVLPVTGLGDLVPKAPAEQTIRVIGVPQPAASAPR